MTKGLAIQILRGEVLGTNEQTHEAVFMAIKALKNEPKRGKWIETSEGTMCSNCNKFPYDDGEYHIANWHSDFCPNCGATMDKGDEE